MRFWSGKLRWGGKAWLCALALCSILGLAACSDNNQDKTATSGNATPPAHDAPALPTGNATPAAENAPAPVPADGASGPSLPAAPEPTAENTPGLNSGKLDFAKFCLEVKASPEAENYKVVALSHGGKTVAENSDIYRSVDPGATAKDFPLPGCASMTVELFTGGANCCFGYYILTSCPDEDVAAFHEPTDGSMGAATLVVDGVGGYPMDDPAFMYYSPEGRSGDAALSLNRVESPRPTRYVVFEANAWREDKIGEFAPAYAELAAQAKALYLGLNPVAPAICRAYYTHMAGADAAKVKDLLKAELPAEFVGLSDTIFNDIVNAAAEFKPFTQVPLR